MSVRYAEKLNSGKSSVLLQRADRHEILGEQPPDFQVSLWGIRLRRDNWASVRYAEELNSAKNSVLLQRADRHEILDQKPADFQLSV